MRTWILLAAFCALEALGQRDDNYQPPQARRPQQLQQGGQQQQQQRPANQGLPPFVQPPLTKPKQTVVQHEVDFDCPSDFGFYPHHKSCDKYYACNNGTASLKLCGNGLVFDDVDSLRENCAYPFSVKCGDRTDLEPPISTPHCPRLYGIFEDKTNCRVFYSCWNGESSRYECPPGLAYDNDQRVCVWADLVDRCDQREVAEGFVCPDPAEVEQPGVFTRHAHPTDCRKFYVCIEGQARPYGCSLGTVFNVDTLQCDDPENVQGCENYYGDLDVKTLKKQAKKGKTNVDGDD